MEQVRTIIRRQRAQKRRAPARRPRWQVVAWCAAGGAALALAATALFALLTVMRVHSVSIEGTERLTQADFRPVLERALGTPILLVRLDDVRRQIESTPGVRTARLARRLPGTLAATVVERRAVARALIGGRFRLLDEQGMVFQSARPLPGDATLPEIRGLLTTAGETKLFDIDLPAIAALRALEEANGGSVPDGTTLDLSARDRIVLRPGPDAGTIWLDRRQPERNLRNLFGNKSRVAGLAPNAAIDLRFKDRLTLVPLAPEGDGSATE